MVLRHDTPTLYQQLLALSSPQHRHHDRVCCRLKAGAEPIRRGSPSRFTVRPAEPPGGSGLGSAASMQQAGSEGESVPFRFEMEDSAGGSTAVTMPGSGSMIALPPR